MSTPRFLLSSSLSLLLAPLAFAGQDPSLEMRLEKLAESLETARLEGHIPGMSIAIVKDDQVVFARGFGLADVKSGRPADTGTIYAIGSTTKAFTATLVGMLVQEELADWDDPVSLYLPYFELPVRSTDANAKCTLRDLLSHRHGFARMSILFMAGSASRETILRTAVGAEPWDDFRKRFHYCNVTYLAAGEAAGVAGDTSWDELMRERIFKPLGMRSSTLTRSEAQQDPRLALGYKWDEHLQEYVHAEMINLSAIGPAGSVNSNVLDMAQWLRLQLGEGELEGEQLIASELLLETWEPQIQAGEGMSYGLGWMLREHDGRKLVEHGGNINGFSAQIGMLPEESLGFVLLMNRDIAPLQQPSLSLVFDALLDDWPAQTAGATDGQEAQTTLSLAELEEYAGSYVANFASFKEEEFGIAVSSSTLALHIPSQGTNELKHPDAEGKWYFASSDQISISFERNAREKVVGLVLHQGPYHFEVPRKGVPLGNEEPPEGIERFVGSYVLAKGTKRIEFAIVRGRLNLQDSGNSMDFHAPDADGHAAMRARDDQGVSFHFDADGQVDSLSFHGNAGDRLFHRVVAEESQGLPTLEAVLQLRKNAARSSAWKAAGGISVRGSAWVAQAGLLGTLTLHSQGYDRFANHMDFGAFGRISMLARGEQAWSYNPMQGLEVLKGDELIQGILAHPAAAEGDWSAFYDSLEVIGKDSVNERAVHVLRLKKGDLPSRIYRVDALSGDLLRIDQTILQGPIRLPVTIHYSNFEEHAGMRRAMRIEVENPASGKIVMLIETIETGQVFDDDVFSLEGRKTK